MYLVYKRKDGVVEDLVYRQVGNAVEIAVYGDFRCGYVSYTYEEFEDVFLSRAIKVLKNKPRTRRVKK